MTTGSTDGPQLDRPPVEEPVRKLPASERFKNYATGASLIIPIIGTALLSAYGVFLKGEPAAKKAQNETALVYKEIAAEVNTLRTELEKTQAALNTYKEYQRGVSEGQLLALVATARRRKPYKRDKTAEDKPRKTKEYAKILSFTKTHFTKLNASQRRAALSLLADARKTKMTYKQFKAAFYITVGNHRRLPQSLKLLKKRDKERPKK